MTCPNCNKPTSRLLIYSGGVKACANCLGLSETAGVKIDGTLTRGSDRVREQQRHHEADFMMPHVFDRNTRTLTPNPDFIKHYPDKLTSNFSQKELEKAGMGRASKIFKADKEKRARFADSQSKGITFRTTPS